MSQKAVISGQEVEIPDPFAGASTVDQKFDFGVEIESDVAKKGRKYPYPTHTEAWMHIIPINYDIDQDLYMLTKKILQYDKEADRLNARPEVSRIKLNRLADEKLEMEVAICCKLVVDWGGFEEGDKPIPCDDENKRRLFLAGKRGESTRRWVIGIAQQFEETNRHEDDRNLKN